MTSYANLKVSGPKNSELTITAEISPETLETYRKEILDHLRKDFEAPGFRKGHVPEEIFIKRIDEYSVLQDAAYDALEEAYRDIIRDKNLEPFGPPEITITKLALGNAVEFTARVPVVPEFSLPNYKKLAKEVKFETPPEVTDVDVENVIAELQKMHIASSPNKDEPVPEINDEFIKKLGNFQSVQDFKNKVKENLKTEKEFEAKKKHREAIVAHIVAESKIVIPKSVTDQELRAFKERMEKDLEAHDTTLAAYLEKVKKTEAELMDEERVYIENQLKTKLVIDHIAKEEKIELNEGDIAREMQEFSERRPDIKSDSARYYAEAVLKTEKVLELLEKAV